MEELYAGIAEAVDGVRQDPFLPGVILLLVLSLARRRVSRTFLAFVGKGRYFTVTIKRRSGWLRVDLKANGSGHSMQLRISWKRGSKAPSNPSDDVSHPIPS